MHSNYFNAKFKHDKQLKSYTGKVRCYLHDSLLLSNEIK